MLRPAEPDDLDAIRSWRNQQANREVSVNQHEITPDEHRQWWSRVSVDPTKRVLVFEVDGRPIGAVNFFDLDLDTSPATGAWGFFLDHDTLEQEGTAFTAWMKVMGEAVDYAFGELGLDELAGEVLPHNEAVRMMNRRFRFTEGPEETREGSDGPVTVLPITLRKVDRRVRKGS